MAKIGTAHVEIKPVVDEAALAEITRRVADAVAAGVALGMSRVTPTVPTASPTVYPWSITCGTPSDSTITDTFGASVRTADN